MTTARIAAALISLRLAGRTADAIQQYYAPDVVCLDVSTPTTAVYGKAVALLEHERWSALREIHEIASVGPWLTGERVVVQLIFGVTRRDTLLRVMERETIIYRVRDGFVHQVQFFVKCDEPVVALPTAVGFS